MTSLVVDGDDLLTLLTVVGEELVVAADTVGVALSVHEAVSVQGGVAVPARKLLRLLLLLAPTTRLAGVTLQSKTNYFHQLKLQHFLTSFTRT